MVCLTWQCVSCMIFMTHMLKLRSMQCSDAPSWVWVSAIAVGLVSSINNVTNWALIVIFFFRSCAIILLCICAKKTGTFVSWEMQFLDFRREFIIPSDFIFDYPRFLIDFPHYFSPIQPGPAQAFKRPKAKSLNRVFMLLLK